VAGGGFSTAGIGSSVAGGSSSVVGGGSSGPGEGSSVAGGVVGRLVVGGGAAVRGGAAVVGSEVSTVLGGDVSPVLGEGSSETGIAVLGVGRVAGEDTTELLLAFAIRASPEPAPAKPSRTFRTVFCTVSLLPWSTVTACSSICSATPGRMRSTTCRGIGLSESGANQVRNETTTTAAAITPAPANKDLCLSPPRRPRSRFGRRRAGAFIPRPLLLSRINFSIRRTLLSKDPADEDPAYHEHDAQAQREQRDHVPGGRGGLVDLLLALGERVGSARAGSDSAVTTTATSVPISMNFLNLLLLPHCRLNKPGQMIAPRPWK
jgi:hypothetical protein